MKRIILVLVIFYSVAAQAQKKLPFLLRADFGISNIKASTGKGSSIFASGIGAETFIPVIPLDESSRLSVNPNLSYLHTGYETTGGGDVQVNYISLGLPLTFELNGLNTKEEIGLMFGAGAFINVAASGKFRNLSIDDYKKMSFGNGTADNRKTTDAGLLLKSAIRIKKLYIGTQYNYGTSNVVPTDRISNGSYIKTRNFLFYVSYAIGGKK
jgi:hypothetical protein